MPAAQVRDKVQRILADELGSVTVDRDGDFSVTVGSAVVFVRVFDRDNGTTIVRSWAIMLSSVPLTPDVYRWAATEGQDYFFGRAQVIEGEDGKGDIDFSHTLLGDFLDPDELKYAVLALAYTADDLDDQLQARFGGKKFLEG